MKSADADSALLIPLGIPLGQTVTEPGASAQCFGVRRARRFVALSAGEYTMWQASRQAVSVAALIATMKPDGAEPTSVSRLIDHLIDQRLALLLPAEDPDAAWPDLAPVRPIPRGFGLGNQPEELSVFTIGGPGLVAGLRVDALGYALWTCVDGLDTFDTIVGSVSGQTGLSPRFLRSRLIGLLPAAVRSGLLYLDPPPLCQQAGDRRGR